MARTHETERARKAAAHPGPVARRRLRNGSSERPVRESAREGARGAFRDAIVSAAERVFARSGFYATKMTEIAREAGVGVGTLYNYFESKEVIFAEIVVDRQAEFDRTVQAAATSEDPVERLRQIVQSCLSYLEEHGALLAIFQERGAVTECDVERLAGPRAARGYERLLDLIEKHVRAAVRAKRIRGDIDVRLLVAMLSGAMNGAAHAWLSRGRRGRLASVTGDLIELFLQGAASR
jgi:TetR/AcrR family transcriptional regulator, fatty acid metabolism regulator protein